MTIIESFSLGIPVICFDLGNMGIAVIEGENGAKFDPLSTDGISEAISRFNTYNYEKLRRKCLLTFEEKFSEVSDLSTHLQTEQKFVKCIYYAIT